MPILILKVQLGPFKHVGKTRVAVEHAKNVKGPTWSYYLFSLSIICHCRNMVDHHGVLSLYYIKFLPYPVNRAP